MQKNRKKSFENLMKNREKDLFFLYNDSPITEVVLQRLMTFKGVKRYYYTLMFIVENEVTNKDLYRGEFEFAMSNYITDKVSSTELEKRATTIIQTEIKIVDDVAPAADDFIAFEDVK